MIQKLIAVIIVLGISPIVEAQQLYEPKVNLDIDYEVLVYPEEIYFGDPVYIIVRAKNISDKPVQYGAHVNDGVFWYTLKSDEISAPYYMLLEGVENETGGTRDYIKPNTYQPGDSWLYSNVYREVPFLEDMDTPFWREAKTQLNAGKNITAYIEMERTLWKDGRKATGIIHTSKPLLIKPRPNREMELLETWLADTPDKFLPVPMDRMVREGRYYDTVINLKSLDDVIPLDPNSNFVSKTRTKKIKRNSEIYQPSHERFIEIRGHKVFPYHFLRWSNRKPGDPICPETWQGWKELEDRLAESTMKDEIRLTRMMVQYCDTEDDAVLDELKSWFAKMNELQRINMVQNVLDITLKSLARKDAEPQLTASLLVKFYCVIREYDTIPKLYTTLELGVKNGMFPEKLLKDDWHEGSGRRKP